MSLAIFYSLIYQDVPPNSSHENSRRVWVSQASSKQVVKSVFTHVTVFQLQCLLKVFTKTKLDFFFTVSVITIFHATFCFGAMTKGFVFSQFIAHGKKILGNFVLFYFRWDFSTYICLPCYLGLYAHIW